MDLTTHWAGYLAIAIFVLAYTLVILEEKIHLRKSKPVIVAAGLIWAAQSERATWARPSKVATRARSDRNMPSVRCSATTMTQTMSW